MRLKPVVLVFSVSWAVFAAEPPPADPIAALTEGNRLFRNGQLEAAVEVYRAGYSPAAPDPVLAYNLGTALHHLDRLPEAILWYRRAGDSHDPWLADNLAMARAALDARALPPSGLAGSLTPRTDALRWLGVLLAWSTLAAVVVRPGLPPWAFAAALVLCVVLYGAAVGLERWGPRPAVLLQDCPAQTDELPAGTEAWGRPRDDGTFAIAGTGTVCSADAIALVDPEP